MGLATFNFNTLSPTNVTFPGTLTPFDTAVLNVAATAFTPRPPARGTGGCSAR